MKASSKMQESYREANEANNNADNRPQLERRKTARYAIEKASGDAELDNAARDIVMKAVLIIVFYLGCGTLIYSAWEGWGVVDALWFSTVTLTTVGFGDQEDWSGDGVRFFTAIYALVGIMLIGSALGVIGAQVVEQNEQNLNKARTAALEHKEALVELGRSSSAMNLVNSGTGKLSQGITKTFSLSPMAKKLLPSFFTLVICIVIGCVLAHLDDNDLSAVECFYFAVITMTTIGYGDISPGTQTGKGFGTLYVLFGCAAVAQVLGSIAGIYIDAKQEEARLKVLKKKITLEDFTAFDVDGDGCIERSEFIVRKLMLMGLVNQTDVALCESEFTDMDVDGSGEITLEDLAHHLEEVEKMEKEKEEGETNI